MSLVTQCVTQLLGGAGHLLPKSDGCGITKWGLPRLLNLRAKFHVETKAKSCGINTAVGIYYFKTLHGLQDQVSREKIPYLLIHLIGFSVAGGYFLCLA